MLQTYCDNDSRIKVIDAVLTRDQLDGLERGCNIFLSMHRSEGFGFGPAEALASGKIVISTDYGGTCDFINFNTGYPVDFKLIPVKNGEYPYSENQIWADPSIESAAHALKNIYNNFDHAVERAKNGRNLIIQNHSFQVTGQRLRSVLEF